MAGMNELIFLFRAAVGGFAMDPVIAMRRATMMDDDMDSTGVGDKDWRQDRSESTRAIFSLMPT